MKIVSIFELVMLWLELSSYVSHERNVQTIMLQLCMMNNNINVSLMIDAILCLAGVNCKIYNKCLHIFHSCNKKLKYLKKFECNFSKDTQDIKCIFKCWTWKTIKSHKCFSGLLLLYFSIFFLLPDKKSKPKHVFNAIFNNLK